ncbi:MAG: hypothetical protein EB084_04215 [Proteobacteria bacterium]|nr:hypothetical protein [Pseudomonadota bacterium]
MRTTLKLLAIAFMVLIVSSAPATAQLVLVDNEYYVTEMRPGKGEFGVALSKGQYTQNWVRLKLDTKIAHRRWLGQGKGFVDETVSPERLFSMLKIGSKVRVNGGRNFDGSVNAKRIWF